MVLAGAAEFTIEEAFTSGGGCRACSHTGYKGRIGVFELLEITDEIRGAVHERHSAERLREIVRSAGVPSLAGNATSLLRSGVTSPEEVVRVIS